MKNIYILILFLCSIGLVHSRQRMTESCFSENTLLLSNIPNHAPSGTDKTITSLEDIQYVFTAADFGFSDPLDDPPHAFMAVKITTLPSNGTLKIQGVSVTTGQFILVTSINLGELTFIPFPNANGTPYTSFTFQVQDNGGTANGGVDLDPTPNTITFNITSVNDAPSGVDKTLTAIEDNVYIVGVSDITMTDPNDSPPNTLSSVKFTTLPSLGSLRLNGVPVTVGQFITVTNIALGQLTYFPVTNGNGAPYTTFTFQVQDNGGTTNGGINLDPTPNTITFNVTAVNDAPSFVIGANQSACKNSSLITVTNWCTALNDGDPEVTQNLSFVVTNNNNPLFSSQPAVSSAGTLTYTPALNATGTATLSVKIMDDGGTANGGVNESPIQMATITIKPDGTWIGVTSIDWFTSSNWCGNVPTATTYAVIAPATFQPVISGANAICSHITMMPTTTLNITAPRMLTVTGQ